MKHLFSFLSLLLLFGAAACIEESESGICPSEVAADHIWLRIETGRSTVGSASRTVGDDAENRITHLDVLLFDSEGQTAYYQHVAAPQTTMQLAVPKSAFAADARYDVYVFANCPSSARLDEVADFTALKDKRIRTANLYATGLLTDADVPQTFLMDGRTSAVLNPTGAETEDMMVSVHLSRAAAKIVLKLHAGADARFLYDGGVTPTGNIVRRPVNFPIECHLAPLSDEEMAAFTPELFTPVTAAATGVDYALADGRWTATITLYAYPNDWSLADAFSTEPRVLLKVPLWYLDSHVEGATATIRENNYYLVEVNNAADENGNASLRRNHIYSTSFEINGLGGTQVETAVPIDRLSYATQPWDDIDIEVGGDADTPQFLSLSAELLRMDNLTEDHSVRYSSSSQVAVTVNAVYYYNKFGIRTDLSPAEIGLSVLPSTTTGVGVLDITGTPRPETDNAIRYIAITVTNQTGQTCDLLVMQYPLVYITNSLGYFSYRSDFVNNSGQPTTWLHHESSGGGNTDKTGVGLINASSESDWRWSNYSSQRNDWVSSWNGEKVFVSKIQRQDIYDTSTGLGQLASYGWFVFWWNSSWFETSPVRNNAHIYQVRITSTSGDYVLGRPRMKTYTDPDGTVYQGTDDGDDNRKLVSPSFMIASQLGLAQSGTLIERMQQAASHCEKYVEVAYRDAANRTDYAADLVVYDDWRLPTEAELKIIGRFQTGSLVMDVVLDRPNYWCATGILEGVGAGAASDGTAMTGTGIRCVRDAYRPK